MLQKTSRTIVRPRRHKSRRLQLVPIYCYIPLAPRSGHAACHAHHHGATAGCFSCPAPHCCHCGSVFCRFCLHVGVTCLRSPECTGLFCGTRSGLTPARMSEFSVRESSVPHHRHLRHLRSSNHFSCTLNCSFLGHVQITSGSGGCSSVSIRLLPREVRPCRR